jgi:hypothetical protein
MAAASVDDSPEPVSEPAELSRAAFERDSSKPIEPNSEPGPRSAWARAVWLSAVVEDPEDATVANHGEI